MASSIRWIFCLFLGERILINFNRAPIQMCETLGQVWHKNVGTFLRTFYLFFQKVFLSTKFENKFASKTNFLMTNFLLSFYIKILKVSFGLMTSIENFYGIELF